MSIGLSSKRWLGVTLFIALLSLFASADLRAQEAKPVDMVPSWTCDLGDPDSDPWMDGTEPVSPCADLKLPEIKSVDLFGDLALMRVVEGDEVQSHVYRRTGTMWERIYVLSKVGEDYLIELEYAWLNP
jgi:hypothetical protein